MSQEPSNMNIPIIGEPRKIEMKSFWSKEIDGTYSGGVIFKNFREESDAKACALASLQSVLQAMAEQGVSSTEKNTSLDDVVIGNPEGTA